ncbi:NrsF family protein [Dyella sp.]|uniref:NrsF family protein n=1 Tax=Dyella sp. TaxID=1869338 RepID=UPI002ED5C305
MAEPLPIDSLIKSLSAQAAPVRRLLSPGRRTLGWALVVVVAAAMFFWHFGMHGMLLRWEIPDAACSGICSYITAITAGFAAFALAVPGRSKAWAWLPLPSALVWMASSGWGCLRYWIQPGVHQSLMPDSADCLVFIVALSLPLSALLIWLLRKAYSVYPVLSAVMVGLASASASAALLGIFHPYVAAASDLIMHALAVLVVIAVNTAMSGRLLRPR